jgi:class 3 adenylate cyclase/tetratricopeptide (TPR) repeat protein
MITCPNCGEQNPERFRLCGYCGTPLAPPSAAAEVRKTVTIIFSDLKGSTALGETLDSEALREVMSSYFDAMRAEIERHGGLVEKYIGDAVMAVFGLPTLHEDDALRAVRAAHAMRGALERFNEQLEASVGIRLANRTGVHTGEVVAGDPSTGQRLVTGDPVNTAARLEQTAPANEVLIGELTYNLVRDAVEVEPVEPLELKGKAERVAAYRLIAVRGEEGRARRQDAPLVGRQVELDMLRTSFEETAVSRTPRMLVVLGDAGMGKSRLIREFVESVAGRATVVRGRCLSYGEGITFWPLVEIIRGAADIHEDDPPPAARQKLRGLVADADVAARIASIAGLNPTPFQLPELQWGARRLLELIAERQPLVVVIDDLHWAEPAFLDFVEHVLDESSAPILLLATARHDLLESRPELGELEQVTYLNLAPLSESDSGQIVENLLGQSGLPETVRSQIVAAAEGNPLFVEQMLSMLIESGALRNVEGNWVRLDESGDITVPPTIQALLAARLDRLGRDERAVIEPASVVGLEFAEPAVAALAPDAVRSDLPQHLATLERRRLVRAEASSSTGEHGYRFQHLLIRDAAYNGMLKRARATLHERFVAWADQANAEVDRGVEFEEILAYHLEQAYRNLRELGPLDAHGIDVGRDAARRLTSAGRRALARGDMHAAANLFGRAVSTLPADDADRLALLPDLAETLIEGGRFDEATAALDEAAAAADESWDERLGAHAALVRVLVDQYRGGGDFSGRALRAADAAVAVFERDGDQEGLVRVWRVRFGARAMVGSYDEAASAAEQIIEHAQAAGDARNERRGGYLYAQTALTGPTPVDEAIARCESVVARSADDHRTEGLVLVVLGELRAMRGEFDLAREAYERGRAMLEELGRSLLSSSTSVNGWRIEFLAGDLAAAERELLRDFERLAELGEQFLLSTVAARLATVLVSAGRPNEATRFVATAEAMSGPEDVEAQALWRGAKARQLSVTNGVDEAITLATEAVELLRSTDSPVFLADALVDLGEVLRAGGRVTDAESPLREAMDLYAAKGSVACLERPRRVLGEAAKDTPAA